MHGCAERPLVSPDEAIPAYLAAARVTNPEARFVGVSLNTADLGAAEAERVLRETSERLDLPCVDPMRTGVGYIVEELESLCRSALDVH